MTELNVKVHYLAHSGFAVETAHNLLVFDYYQGTVPLTDKQTSVFSSHSHPDHYNPVIFQWQNERPNIQYILSNDIQVKHPNSKITTMSPYEQIQLGDLQIKTFGSTDLGVSFLVNCEEINIFHAGDLNWWYWSEDTAEGIAQAEAAFKAEIAKIKGERIDLAFFPVDPRLEHNCSLGADYFMQELTPRFLIPMHFWNKKQAIQEFAEARKERSTEIIALTKRGQEIML